MNLFANIFIYNKFVFGSSYLLTSRKFSLSNINPVRNRRNNISVRANSQNARFKLLKFENTKMLSLIFFVVDVVDGLKN